jgi:hypothetical protein
LENKVHREDRKWRSALTQPDLPVPVARLAAPLAWGVNLWLLLVVWPLVAGGASSLWLAAAAATPLLAGVPLASIGLRALASGCFLVAFPLALAGVVAVEQRSAASELGVTALAVVAASMWVYGAAVSRVLRLPIMEEGGGLRIETLQGRGRSPRLHAARLRASRARNIAAGLTVLGAAVIAIAAPSAGDARQLNESFGDDPKHAAVLIAMVGVAVGVGVVSVFTTGLLRPPSLEDRRPFAPMRAALGLLIALAGAATYYVIRSS